MESSGQLENTILVLTSDHGELFERGTRGHLHDLLYEPVLKIPLVIYDPQVSERQDIYTRTSAVDVLPSLLQAVDAPAVDWIEGQVIPPYTRGVDEGRAIFAMNSTISKQDQAIKHGFFVAYKAHYKMIEFNLESGETIYELYDLQNDPEELENLYQPDSSLAKDLIAEFHAGLDQKNKAFNK